MKAYVVRNRSSISPFQKAASQLRLKNCTVESRLQAQLKKAGFEVAYHDSLSPEGIEPGSLVLQDDIVTSDGFFRRLLSAIPDKKRNYQIDIDATHFTLLSAKDVPTAFRKLPIYFYGDTAKNAEVIPLPMTPVCVHEVEQGLPSRMHMLTKMRVYFLDFYAVQVEYWFDLQTATSLYCREFVVNLIRPAHAVLPAWMMAKITSSTFLMEKCNSIGKNTRIHPTAILEGCVVGDNVEIGPFTYLRSSVIGDNSVIREKSTVKMSYVGEGGFLMGSDVVNCYIGAESAICSPMLFNVVFGERSFISGGSGFADFIVGSGTIVASIDGKDVPSGLNFLGSAVGDDCFLGANLIFAPGRTIPDGTKLLDHGLIKAVPTTPGGAFVLSGTHLLQVPDSFFGKPKS